MFLLSFQYHLFSFTNFVELAETRVLMGYSLTLVTLLNILINLLINLAVTGVALKLWIKTQYHRLKAKCSKKAKSAQQSEKSAMSLDDVIE